MNKLSVTSKLDGIKSWSLQAVQDCPGSVGKNGQLVDACSGCYATMGFYVYNKPKAVRANNKLAWQESTWVADMVRALDNERYFRWYDSGDMYALELAEKMYEVMVLTPHVKHWLPTRMAKFAKFKSILQDMNRLENVMVRFSSDSINGEYTPGVHGSTIIPNTDSVPSGVFVCRAYDNDGKCSGCRACYDKSVPVIAYVAHGRKMKKIIRIQQEAV